MKEIFLKARHLEQLEKPISLKISPPDLIYFMGICGTAMANLAVFLKQKGFPVLGSDQNIYPPMSLELEKAGIPVFNYDKNNITDSIKLIVVGNVISSHHPEILKAKQKLIPVISFPEFLQGAFLSKTKNIVITGTHGKSTSTALMSYTAHQTGQNPSFFIGAVAKDFSSSFCIADSPYFILEGDEYDSSFFAKRAKFFYYKPSYVILTSLEFDHADIYNDLAEIKSAFCDLVKKIPPDGCLVACADEPHIEEILPFCRAQVLTYGVKKGDFKIEQRQSREQGQVLTVLTKNKRFKITSSLLGEHNALNVLAVFILANHLGWPEDQILKALKNFKGLKRRMEFRFEFQGVKIFEDFAHHPTAVQAGLSALKESHPKKRLIALFEPRSFTSRLNVFQQNYVSSFLPADLIFIAPAYDSSQIPKEKRFSITKLAQDLQSKGKDVFIFSSFNKLEKTLKETLQKDDIAVFMSSGAFNNILERLKS